MSMVLPTFTYTTFAPTITAATQRGTSTSPIISYPNTNHAQPNTSIETQLPLHRPRRRTKDPKPHTIQVPIKPLNPLTTSLSKNQNGNPIPTTSSGGEFLVSDVLRLMDSLRLPISADMYASLVEECTDTLDVVGATHLHSHIISSSCDDRVPITNSLPFFNHRLLLMLVSCGCLDLARQVFDEMLHRESMISWGTMIVGLAHNGLHEEAISLFVEMLEHHGDMLSFPPWLILCVLMACVHTLNLGLGKQVHGWLFKAGHSTNLFLNSSLINFYGKCGILPSADFVFDWMHHIGHDTVVWTSVIVSHCREKLFDEVLNAFNEMGRAGVRKNSYTFSSVLRACGKMRDNGWSGRQVHADAIKCGVDSNTFVQCGLVDMYGKCDLLESAEMVFETICNKENVACWNAMLTGYTRNGFCIEALKFLYHMKAAGVEPQESLLKKVRMICGSGTL